MTAVPKQEEFFTPEKREAFLVPRGWRYVGEIGADMSPRRYFRVKQNGRTAVLMECMPDADNTTPGHRLGDFIRIGDWLRGIGLKTPEIFEADEAAGFLLLEDFGDISFAKALERGAARAAVYSLAVDVLKHLREQAPDIDLPRYHESHVHEGRRRVVDWYVPLVRGEKNPDGLAEEYLAIWDGIEKDQPPCPQGFLHVDFHPGNLMWLPEEEGLGICGLLDFQGAMKGPVPYDLANLLEGGRIEMPEDIRTAMLDHYCEGMHREQREAFLSWYRVLAAQFHCRIIGQFIRMAIQGGNERYLEYLPHVSRMLKHDLEDPLLQPIKIWLAGQGIDFEKEIRVSADAAALIRDDAF